MTRASSAQVIGYCWAEALEDESEGPTETVQEAIKAYAGRRRWILRIQLETPEEAFTEFSDRPWGREVKGMLRAGDILLVPDPSYLFRTPGQGRKFLDWARKKKIIVHCMDSGEDLAGDKVATQLMSVLQALEKFEEQLPAIRMRSQKRQLKKEGRYLGGRPPFGFLLDGDGMLRPNPAAAKAMRLMRRRRAQGVSLRGIAIELNRSGITISHSGVASALRAADAAAGEGGE